MSHVMCHVLCFTWHVSCITFQVSQVTCQLRQKPQILPLQIPPGCAMYYAPQNTKNFKTPKSVQIKNKVSQFCSFSSTLFDQSSPVHAVPGPGRWHNSITDIATYRLNQPRVRFSENIGFDIYVHLGQCVKTQKLTYSVSCNLIFHFISPTQILNWTWVYYLVLLHCTTI